MDEYVFQILVNKKLLTEDELKIIENKDLEIKTIEPWDPLGTLA